MDDFYKNIKDNLESREEPQFDERAWKDMKKRLNKKPWNGTPIFGWFWVLPLALGSLFLSNIFFFKKLNEANEKISKLELKRDTIYETKYVYQYDTIYQQRVEKQYVVMTQPHFDFYPSQLAYFNSSTNYSPQSNWVNSAQNSLTFAELKYLFDDENENPLTENSTLNTPSALFASPFIESDITKLKNDSEYPMLTYLDPVYHKKKKRPFQKLAADIQPFDFQAGVLGGFAFPQHEQLAETKGYSVGIFGSMSFSNHIRMWGEGSYYKVEFKSNVMGESLGIPVIEVPDDNYEFNEASVHQPFLQYTLGLQYVFYPKNKWKPYFGVGYTFSSMLPYEVSYDFDHENDDLELSIEESIHRSETIMNMALITGGIEGKLSKRIGLKLEGYFRWNGNKEGLMVTNVYGIRSLLFYKF